MFSLKNNTLSELVTEDYRLAPVFKKYGIDYYCRGERTLQEVCESKNISSKILVQDLQNAIAETDTKQLDFHSWSISELACYIEEKHHSYIKNRAPKIIENLFVLCKEYGDLRPELTCIMELFTKVFKKIENHNNKERFVLFPYVRKMGNLIENKETIDCKYLGIIKIHSQNIIQENNFEGQHFLEIRELCNNYAVQNKECNAYKVVMELLNDFETKLELQLHLENNLLYPKALEVEALLLKNRCF